HRQQEALRLDELKKQQQAVPVSTTETVTASTDATVHQSLHPAGSVNFPKQLGGSVNTPLTDKPANWIAQIDADLVAAGIELTTETVNRLYNAVKAGRIRYFSITQ
ncbi:TPA: hypothetical protein PXM75_004510, partial [Yersinia enterocolitica]|nr:hypothetical protein [Yersinia enterocolitica]